MQFNKTACALAASAVLLASTAHAGPAELGQLVGQKAAMIQLMHRKAERSLVTVAQDEHYREYFTTGDHHHREVVKDRLDRIALETQRKFHVEEMCLIDPSGTEITRIVRNMIADDLSTEEASAIFFGPGFEQRPRQIHVSPVYMSPDTGRWVIGYVTPIAVEGENRAILHFEHDLGIFQDMLDGAVPDGVVLLAVNEAGWIVADTRHEIGIDQRGELVDPEHYFERFAPAGTTIDAVRGALDAGGGTGTLEWNGDRYEVAYQQAGRWTIMALAQR